MQVAGAAQMPLPIFQLSFLLRVMPPSSRPRYLSPCSGGVFRLFLPPSKFHVFRQDIF